MTKVNRTSTGKFIYEGTGSLRIPAGTSGQRPDVTSEPGWIRFNTVSDTIEFNDGNTWVGVASANILNQFSGSFVEKTGDEMTGRLKLPAGTLDNPSLTFQNASAVGFVSTSSNSLSLALGGVRYLTLENNNLFFGGVTRPTSTRVDSVGRMFIRTDTNPVNSLTVSGTAQFTDIVTGSLSVQGNSQFGNNRITNLGMPVNDMDAATKAYVDAAITGLSWKDSVLYATTSNITLTGLQMIDGFMTVAGDRILVKNQTNQTQNGIYEARAGAWVRTADADNTPVNNEIGGGTSVFVSNGVLNINSGWTVTSPAGVATLGVSNIVWAQFSGSTLYVAGTGISINSNIIAVDNTVIRTTGNQSLGGVKTFTSNIVGNLTGNASSATKLQNIRTIGITGGITGTPTGFDGTANININVTGIDASDINSGIIPNAHLPTNLVFTNTQQSITGRKIFSERVTVNHPTFANYDLSVSAAGNEQRYCRMTMGVSGNLNLEFVGNSYTPASARPVLTLHRDGNNCGLITFNTGENILAAEIRPAGTSLVTTTTVVTREKGDARYVRPANITGGGSIDVTITGTSIRVSAPTYLTPTDATAGFVTINTAQTVTGVKTFNANQIFNNPLTLNSTLTGNNNITLTAGQFTGNGTGLTNLNANNLSSGTIPDARITGSYTGLINLTGTGVFTANSFVGNGASLTALNAANISTGTLSSARLPTNVVYTNTTQTITGVKTFTGTQNFANVSAAGVITASIFTVQNTLGNGFRGNVSDNAISPSFTWEGDTNTGMYNRASGQIGFTTDGVDRARITENNIFVFGDSPSFTLFETGAPTTYNRTQLNRNDELFSIRTIDNNDILKANDYTMRIGATGAFFHSFQINGTSEATISEIGNIATLPKTIMTKEKSDAKYAKLTGGNVFAGTQRFTGPIRENFEQITAAGLVQADTPLIDDSSVVDISGGAANTGVRLPVCSAGLKVVIFNTTTTDKLIYPRSANNINPTAANVPLRLGANTAITFYGRNSTTWLALHSFYG